MRSLQFAAKHVFFSGAVQARMPCLPDHQWLDSDQQYHALCDYHHEEAIIVYFFAKPNVVLLSTNLLNIKLWKIELDNGKFVFRKLLAKRNVEKTLFILEFD